MSITNYTELQAAVSNWMARGDIGGEATDFIRLGEAALNRELKPVETEAALVAVPTSREIDVSSLNMVEPVALLLTSYGDERPIPPLANGTFPFRAEAGEPGVWTTDGDLLVLDRPADKAYTFRFRHMARFALSAQQPTNWLLTNHPDAYLAATLVWGGVFIEDDRKAVRWKALLDEALPRIRSELKRRKPARLRIDPALAAIGTYHHGGHRS